MVLRNDPQFQCGARYNTFYGLFKNKLAPYGLWLTRKDV